MDSYSKSHSILGENQFKICYFLIFFVPPSNRRQTVERRFIAVEDMFIAVERRFIAVDQGYPKMLQKLPVLKSVRF